MTGKKRKNVKTPGSINLPAATDSDNDHKKIKLCIVHPKSNAAFTGNMLQVNVQAIYESKPCEHEQALELIGAEYELNIILDGQVVATPAPSKLKKNRYTAKIKLKYISEGPHTLQAVFNKIDRVKGIKLVNSDLLDFTIDRTKPFIRSILPSGMISGKRNDLSKVVIEADDLHSGLNLARCSASIDGKILPDPSEDKRGSIVFPVQIELVEGNHRLNLVLLDRAGNKLEHEAEFIIDNSPPVIHYLFPSDGIIIKEDVLLNVIIKAEDLHSGLDTDKCAIIIDDYDAQNLIWHKNCLIFHSKNKFDVGTHKINIILFDRAGNKTDLTSGFHVRPPSSNEEIEEAQRWEQRTDALKERLANDRYFLKKLMVNPRGAITEAGLPYTRDMTNLLPPPLSENHAEFMLNIKREIVEKALEPLLRHISDTLKNNMPQALKQLAEKGIVAEDGSLTEEAKEIVSSLLQDPIGRLEGMGITVTDEESHFIFPSFSKKDAVLMANWLSMVQSIKLNSEW